MDWHVNDKRMVREDELQTILESVPRSALLCFRRDLAMVPFTQALQSLQSHGGPATTAAQVLHLMGENKAMHALTTLFRPQYRCWLYSQHQEAMWACRRALASVTQEKQDSMLKEMQAGRGFCATVRRYLGRPGGSALLKVGRVRVLWMLGGDVSGLVGDDHWEATSAVSRRCRRASRRRHRAMRGVARMASWSSESDVSSQLRVIIEVDHEASTAAETESDSEWLSVNGVFQPHLNNSGSSEPLVSNTGETGNITNSRDQRATRAFLRAFRARRDMQQQDVQ